MRPLMYKLLDAGRTRWWKLAVPPYLRAHGVEVADGMTAYGWPIVSMVSGSSIRLGESVVLCSHPRFTALGTSSPVILRTLRPGASIVVGGHVGMSGAAICAATLVEIGPECLIGAEVRIFDTDFHAISPEERRYCRDPERIAAAPVRIGRNVFIGARATVTKGVTIGDNSVIGAGALVTADVPPNTIAAGVPARVIRTLTGGH